jgi:hypothetical protein
LIDVEEAEEECPMDFRLSGEMPKTKLTAQSLESLSALEGQRTEYFDKELPGFSVRVTPSGGKTFSVLYRRGRRLRRYTPGVLRQRRTAASRTRGGERANLTRLMPYTY